VVAGVARIKFTAAGAALERPSHDEGSGRHVESSGPAGFQGLHPELPLTVYQRTPPPLASRRPAYPTFRLTCRLAIPCPMSDSMNWRPSKPKIGTRHCAAATRPVRDQLARQTQSQTHRRLRIKALPLPVEAPNLVPYNRDATISMASGYELDCCLSSCQITPIYSAAATPQVYPLHRNMSRVVGKSTAPGASNRVLAKAATFGRRKATTASFRDEEHPLGVIQYIGSNPIRAGLPRESCFLWLRPQWIELGGISRNAQPRRDGSPEPSQVAWLLVSA